MKRIPVIIVASLLVGFASVAQEQPKSDPLGIFMTASELPGGFARAGDATQFGPDNVFQLIDGEAELYFPYGFKRVISVTYTHPESPGNQMAAEIYEMASPLDGFGIYSNYRDEDSQLTEVGAEGFRGRTQVMFYKGPHFVKLRVRKAEGQGERMLACAKAIADALPGDTAKATETDVVKIEGAIPNTDRYVAQSLLGYDFWKKGYVADAYPPGFPEDKRASTPAMRVFLVKTDSAEAASAAIEKYVEYLKTSNGQSEWLDTPEGKILKATDPMHKTVFLQVACANICGVARPPDEAQGLDSLKKLLVRVNGK